MALKWPSICWCAVKKLFAHSLASHNNQKNELAHLSSLDPHKAAVRDHQMNLLPTGSWWGTPLSLTVCGTLTTIRLVAPLCPCNFTCINRDHWMIDHYFVMTEHIQNEPNPGALVRLKYQCYTDLVIGRQNRATADFRNKELHNFWR